MEKPTPERLAEFMKTVKISHMVLNVAEKNYVYVHHANPVIGMLLANAKLWGMDTDNTAFLGIEIGDQKFYRVYQTLFDRCCELITIMVLPDGPDRTAKSKEWHDKNIRVPV